MKTTYFIDIPVYRLEKDKYYSQRDAYVEINLYGKNPEEIKKNKEFYMNNSDLERASRKRLLNSYGGPWDFNEIVGYIKLFFFGNQIRGELWQVDRKRFIRTRKKIIHFKSHKVVYELTIPENSSSNEIFDIISAYLNNAKKKLKNRYMDTRHFELIGPYINWNSLYSERHRSKSKKEQIA